MEKRKPIQSFRDLDVYQRSYRASIFVCKHIVPNLPKEERYDLVDQLRRSSKAVPRLIAEGYGKRHQKRGFQKYLDDALAESNETQVGLEHAKDLCSKYVNKELCKRLLKEYDIVSRQLYRLRESWQDFKSISKSPSKPAFKPKPMSRSAKGVTLIELLLVIAIIAIISASAYPMGSSFLARNHLRNKTNEVVSTIRTAQLNAVSGKEGSEWGIKTTNSEIILYKGTDYSTRDNPALDQTFLIQSSISITQVEIYFNKLTGNPSSTATISLNNNIGDSRTVTINEVGIVDVN